MDVPGPGIGFELQLHGAAVLAPLTHCTRPGIEPTPLQKPKPLQSDSYFFFFQGHTSAYRGSQARVQIRAVAASLHYSHSNAARSEPHLQPTPQLKAMLDP